LKTATKLLVYAGLVAGLATYASADTIWNVNATFKYNSLGNTAKGTFELNSSLALVTWNITVSGTNIVADNVYTPSDSIDVYPNSTHLDFYDGSTNQYIDLYLQTGLSNAAAPSTYFTAMVGRPAIPRLFVRAVERSFQVRSARPRCPSRLRAGYSAGAPSFSA
jgi:hypothetical protein